MRYDCRLPPESELHAEGKKERVISELMLNLEYCTKECNRHALLRQELTSCSGGHITEEKSTHTQTKDGKKRSERQAFLWASHPPAVRCRFPA